MKYKISFELPSAEKLSIVIQVLAKEITQFHIEELSSTKTVPTSHKLGSLVSTSDRSMLSSIVLSHFQPGTEFSNSDVAAIFEQKGYSKNSESPTLSRLAKEGKIKRVKYGLYVIPKGE